MEDPRDYEISRIIFIVGFVVAAVSGIVMSILMFVWVFAFAKGVTWPWESDRKTAINLHILLLTVIMIYVQGHGAMIFRCLPCVPKLYVKLIHVGLQLITLIAVSLGLWGTVNAHNVGNQPHFYTLHSWIGIIATVLFYGQFVAGILLLPYIPIRVQTTVTPYHMVLGPLIFISSCIAAATGMMMKALFPQNRAKYKDLPAESYTINFATLFLLIFCLTVTYLVMDPRFKRRPKPQDVSVMPLSESISPENQKTELPTDTEPSPDSREGI